MRYRLGAAATVLLALGLTPAWAQPVQRSAHEEEAPLAAPAKSPGPMTLEQCIDLGLQHQPSLDAARASLSAAQTGSAALNKLLIPRCLSPELAIRREQACLGVTIASANLSQAEVETRYAITRNFFTVQYIHAQQIVINDVLNNLKTSRARAQKLFDSGDPKVKITKIDLEMLDVNMAQVRNKKSQADNGLLRAVAALREAMGLAHDYPLQIAAVGLPNEVYSVKSFKEAADGKDKKKKVEVTTYHRLYNLDKKSLIDSALANRGEIVQANTASQVVNLEIEAQNRIRGWKGGTFAQGADLHVTPVPLMYSNGEYRPGALAPEMPTMLAGRKHDRMARAADFAARANAVVDKTTSLVALDVESQYFKWVEAAEDIEDLSAILKTATDLPKKVQDLDPADFTASAVIQANFTSVMVRSQLNEARHNHALALTGLERATAGAFHVFPVPAAPK
jgi:outer membrane protein TolC